MDGLTEKQQAFVVEYLKCFNATVAAKKAGYSQKTAYSIGSELLNKPEIAQVIENHKKELIQELQNQFVVDAIMAKNVLLQILNDKNASNRDRITAAKDLLDRAGFAPTTKQEITGGDGGVIQIVFADPSK